MRYTFIITLLLVLNIFVYQRILVQPTLRVSFLDVGQGDAIYIRAPNGNDMIVDGGPTARVLRSLSGVMPFSDRQIDVVIATHPDKDHISGLVDVIERYRVGAFIDPGFASNTTSYRALMATVERAALPRYVARRGMTIDLGDGVVASVLSPTEETKGDTNSHSVVLKLSYGNSDFLLTGDAPKRIEGNLVYVYGDALHSEVLKAGHHGSKTSSSEVFVRRVAPEVAIISAGKNNPYGHPHTETLRILRDVGATILSTIEKGTITISSDGSSLTY